jgi:hypothetical protein
MLYAVNKEFAAYNKREIIVMETFLFTAGVLILLFSLKYSELLNFVGFAIIINFLGLISAYKLSKASNPLILGILNDMFLYFYMILLFFFITKWSY